MRRIAPCPAWARRIVPRMSTGSAITAILPSAPIFPRLGHSIRSLDWLGPSTKAGGRNDVCHWISGSCLSIQPCGARLRFQMEITRKRPVHAFLKMWRKNREEIKRLILISGASLELGAEDRPQGSEALDEYRLDSSRSHRLVIAWTTCQPIDRNVVSRAFISLARIYHVLQGVIRGDSGRVSLLAGRYPD